MPRLKLFPFEKKVRKAQRDAARREVRLDRQAQIRDAAAQQHSERRSSFAERIRDSRKARSKRISDAVRSQHAKSVLQDRRLAYKVTGRATVLYLPLQRSNRERTLAHSQNGFHCRVQRIKVEATTDPGQITFRTAMTTGGTLWFGPRPVPATPKSNSVAGKTLMKLAQKCAQKVYRPCVRFYP